MKAATPVAAGPPPRDLVTIATHLPQRKERPDLRAEAAASAKLTSKLASDPSSALPCVLEIAHELCHAGTAGFSLLRPDRADGTTVRWELVHGSLASYQGIDATRTKSPCGLCLDAGTTILVSRPTRVFAWLEGTHPPIIETLIVPLLDDTGCAHGTLWIAHHEPDARCTYDDARIVEQLAQQMMLALRLQEHARDRERAFIVLQSLQVAQRALLSHDVEQERIRRVRAEAAARESARALLFKEAMANEVNHRTKNTLQAASALLTMQAKATSSAEARRALLDGHARLQLLAEVHSLLCIEPNDTQSVFMPRLLQAVCDALARSFGQTCPGVRLEVSCDPISLSADDAIAIALLSNEVVTNAYKHAFADQSSGEISVQLHCSAGQALVLRISDTGTGTGANPMNSKHGMGLKLMRLLSAQVGGVLDVASPATGGGTTVTLKLDRATTFDRVAEPVVRPAPAAGTAA
ncbi:ATP-binding protein [Steroidobacter sp. S1-65]|uniref:histidine kinase n=1 Tax=Steroidobacter gossypii TaxID=2805490 RepID=A0ABS1WVJ3_9GAMM|nr:ATP-binding protein [Steroidobacter gossypii]MBM0104988.1 ATP-binding protein [Steroidobacter gossypii]